MQLIHSNMINSDHIGRVVRVSDNGIAVTIIDGKMRENVGYTAERGFRQLDNIWVLEIRNFAMTEISVEYKHVAAVATGENVTGAANQNVCAVSTVEMLIA